MIRSNPIRSFMAGLLLGSIVSGLMAPAASRAVEPGDTVPAAPTGLTANPGPGRVALSWQPNVEPDIAGYNVYRDTLPQGPSVTAIAAGDIASCTSNGDEATAALLDGLVGDVLTLGDNAYNSGTLAEFQTCFDPSWGRAKARTRPATGNHEYRTLNAADYFTYFGAAAGDPTKGYYSYDYGAWHVVVLNSGDCAVVACAAGSAQEAWLRADLAASDAACTIAVWHHARFSSGSSHGSNAALQPFYQALYDFDADLILTGHEHNYERFAPQTSTGVADPIRGIRQFVVGTGGAGHYGFGPTLANSEVRNSDTFGVLALRLGATGYGWDFVPEAGKTFTDRGSAACHGADGLLSQPGTPLNGATPLTSTSFTDTTAVNGTAHRYVVTAVDDAGQESVPSNEVSATPVPPARITYADDAFGRTRTGGWGNADIGGAYALQGTVADFGVNGSAGTVTLAAAGANRAATLTSVSARDADLSFRVATSKVPTGSGHYIYGVVRRVSSSSEYRVKLRLASNGSVFFQATSVVSSRETALGSEVPATGVTWTPGGFIRVRAEVSGADPTTIRIRVWTDGATEPSTWPYAVSDATPTLQVAGAIGVRAYLSSGASNAPVTVTFDDLRATDIAGPNAAPVVLANDDFSRTRTNGWGSAGTGGAYTLQGTVADYAVNGSEGTVRVAAGANRSATLTSVSAADVDLSFRAALNKLPAGNSQYLYGISRRISATAEYRAKIRIAPTGAVYLQAGSVVGGIETSLGSEVRVTGLTAAPGTFVWLRTQVVGRSPTTIRMRAWADGAPEPSTWQVVTSDSAPGLQVAGGVGLRAYTSGTVSNGPITVSFDDLRATGINGS